MMVPLVPREVTGSNLMNECPRRMVASQERVARGREGERDVRRERGRRKCETSRNPKGRLGDADLLCAAACLTWMLIHYSEKG